MFYINYINCHLFIPGSVTVTPTTEGVGGSNRFFIDYSIGAQSGIIAGVVVVSILVVCVVLGMVICVAKSHSRRENVTLVKGLFTSFIASIL